MEHTKYPTIRTNWYIQQTHVGATNRKANKNNKNYHVLQNQLPLLLTRNTTAKDLYKTTCTHGAHKLHNCKNKVVHTANPFRVYRRVPCPRVQMRPLTTCTDEAPTVLYPPPNSNLTMCFNQRLATLITIMVLYFWWDLDSKKENSPGFVVYFEMLLLLPQERILKTWHLDTSHPENGLSMKRTNFLRLGTKAFPIFWVDYIKNYHTSTNQYSTSNTYNYICIMFETN